MNILRCFLLALLVVSCAGNNQARFPKEITTSTTQQGFDSVYLKYPYRIRIADTLMYVTDLHADDYFCHAFTFPALKYRQSLAHRGKAPGDFLGVGNVIVADSVLYLLDVFGKKICQWDGRQISVVSTFLDMAMALDFARLNDSVFITPDYLGDCRLKFIDRNGKVVREMGSVPTKENASAPKANLGQAWRPFISYNPHNGIVALATQLGEVLEVYNLNNDQAHVSVGTMGEPRLKGATDAFMGYGDVYVGDRYIYTVFWGHPMEKIKSGEIKEQGGDMFRVFDLSGNPVCQYKLDRNITGFTINEATGEVWATDPNNDEQLVSFRVSPANGQQ